jgi:hypothetical protein
MENINARTVIDDCVKRGSRKVKTSWPECARGNAIPIFTSSSLIVRLVQNVGWVDVTFGTTTSESKVRSRFLVLERISVNSAARCS